MQAEQGWGGGGGGSRGEMRYAGEPLFKRWKEPRGDSCLRSRPGGENIYYFLDLYQIKVYCIVLIAKR